MGWSFRRSIKMGALRLNVSGSGVGASIGVRGARVDVGPRGTYVNFGAGGFQYRRKLTNGATQERRIVDQEAGNIRTASVDQLQASTPEWLVTDSQLRLKRWNLFKAYCWACGILFIVIWSSLHAAAAFVLLVLGGAGGWVVREWDRERRTARVLYDVDDPEIVERLAMANGAAQWLGSCAALWHIFHTAPTSDWKKNAGAGTLIRRTITRCAVGALPCFELNVEAWSVPVGPQQLLFLPDRLMVWDGTRLATLPYETILARTSLTRFIEDGGPIPRDGHQVDSTWRFVRRDGGPDLRFSNNAQLPVMRYAELELTSTSGLRVVLQTSTTEAADGAARALQALAQRAATPQIQTVARPGPDYTSPSVSAQATDQEVPPAVIAASVATLLRYLAGADRRVDTEEVAFAERTLGQLLPAQHPELTRLGSEFRKLPTDREAVRRALRTIVVAGPEYRRWVVVALEGLASADGKVTPKEVERLVEMRHALDG